MEPRTKTYVIDMSPISWQRARLAGRKFYNAQKKERLAFEFILLAQHNLEPRFAKAIKVDVTFFMPLPESWTNKQKEKAHFHSIKPDIDNLCKFLLDSLKPVIEDDDLICSLNAQKIYDKHPRTEFTITESA